MSIARAFGALIAGIVGGLAGLVLGTTISCSFSSESMCGVAGVLVGAPIGFLLCSAAFLRYRATNGPSTQTSSAAEGAERTFNDRRNEIEWVIAVSTWVAPLAAALGALGVGLSYNSQTLIASGVLFVLGVLAFAGLLVSWRYYRRGVSLGLWLLFAAILFMIPPGAMILPAVRAGEVHPLGALLAIVGWFGVGLAGPIALTRSRLRAWGQP